MDERQQILEWMGDNDVMLKTGAFKALVSLLQAARRTTPDREAIIEECMQVCRTIAEYFEEESPPQASPTRKQAAGARVCLAAIKQIKTAPTPHQSAALDRLAENNHELGLDYLTAPTSDQGEKS